MEKCLVLRIRQKQLLVVRDQETCVRRWALRSKLSNLIPNRVILQALPVKETISMLDIPARTAAVRMGVLLVSVVALDVAVALFVPHPRLLCAIIPGLIPLLTPVLLLSFGLFDEPATEDGPMSADKKSPGTKS
jgi:hypothetical protein